MAEFRCIVVSSTVRERRTYHPWRLSNVSSFSEKLHFITEGWGRRALQSRPTIPTPRLPASEKRMPSDLFLLLKQSQVGYTTLRVKIFSRQPGRVTVEVAGHVALAPQHFSSAASSLGDSVPVHIEHTRIGIYPPATQRIHQSYFNGNIITRLFPRSQEYYTGRDAGSLTQYY